MAKAGDVITIQFSSSEPLDTTNTFANLNNQNLTISGTGTSYTATHTVKSTDTQGPITTLFYLVDIVGNVATDNTQPVTAVTISKQCILLSILFVYFILFILFILFIYLFYFMYFIYFIYLFIYLFIIKTE